MDEFSTSDEVRRNISPFVHLLIGNSFVVPGQFSAPGCTLWMLKNKVKYEEVEKLVMEINKEFMA